MAYVTADELKAYVGSEIVADESFLADVLLAAESAVNDHCARNFNADTTSATRHYVPEGDLVIIHDVYDSTGLTVAENGGTVTASAYQLEPTNATWTRVAQPYYQIRRLHSCWYRYGAEATIAVTSAKWGWAAVPARVKQATLILAKDLVDNRQARLGVAGFGEFGAIRVSSGSQRAAVAQLAHLRHPMAWGVA